MGIYSLLSSYNPEGFLQGCCFFLQMRIGEVFISFSGCWLYRMVSPKSRFKSTSKERDGRFFDKMLSMRIEYMNVVFQLFL